jgi:uncharacterized protein (DUF169 family)
MDMQLKERFLERWKKYFHRTDLPITFYYSNEAGNLELVKPPSGHQCFIGVLSRVRQGASLCFNVDSIGCGGGKRYLGFTEEIMPNFEYFLSCGIPGKLEGERYKKTPELVKEAVKNFPVFKAPAQFIIFKRWDKLEQADRPEVVIFFAPPDVLSGLFTLASFDEAELNGIFTPFSAGCGTIVQYPYLEKDSARPRGVLGMFDVSARPFVPKETLSLALPMKKFQGMIENMDESFLITASWAKVKARIQKA